MNRDEILSRYRQFREISNWHMHDAGRHLPEAALLRLAKRLGVAKGRTLLCENDNEFQLLHDLALFIPGHNGGPSAFQRYAKANVPPAGSDQALVLEAMLQSRYSLWSIERRHDVAGLVLQDLALGEEEWFVDMCMEATWETGSAFAGRLIRPAGFSMTCGILAPFGEDQGLEALTSTGDWKPANPAAAVTDPRFAMLLCGAALRTGVMGGVVTLEAGSLPEGEDLALYALTH